MGSIWFYTTGFAGAEAKHAGHNERFAKVGWEILSSAEAPLSF